MPTTKKKKSASTKAGKYVHEEIEHVREGKHGARSAKQAIAIGLSKARRAGIHVPAKGKSAKSASSTTKHATHPSAKRSRASLKALKRESHSSTSHRALSAHAKKAAHHKSA